jgi:hypothetical protein
MRICPENHFSGFLNEAANRAGMEIGRNHANCREAMGWFPSSHKKARSRIILNSEQAFGVFSLTS